MGKVLALIASLAVIAAIGTAVWIIDGPSQVRAQRLDALRTRDLDDLAIKIDCYWTLEGQLPTDQDALARRTKSVVGQRRLSGICRQPLPTDPETGANYAYRILEKNAFELCARFNAPSPKEATPTLYAWHARSRDWRHDSGRACFRLTPVKIKNF